MPPDYFSKTGQRWGNPIYRWDRMAQTGFDWWLRRLGRLLDQVDLLRLDHFRAFEAYWEIDAREETAVNGRWVKAPGEEFFARVQAHFGKLPIIAEDLGLITQEVRDLMAHFELPGMAVLHFAFGGGAKNKYLPHNHTQNLVAYTGTHDNDTTVGWWKHLHRPEDAETLAFARDYLGPAGKDDANIHWTLIRLVMQSVALLAIVPLQDLLGLDASARMNTPGKADDNWGWRAPEGAYDAALARRLRDLTATYGRLVEPKKDEAQNS